MERKEVGAWEESGCRETQWGPGEGGVKRKERQGQRTRNGSKGE